MTGLDIFALIILIVLGITILAVWIILGMMPGKIARERHHPQAEAIAVAGWWGVITMGLLVPIAFIWAYTKGSDGPSDDTTNTTSAAIATGAKPLNDKP